MEDKSTELATTTRPAKDNFSLFQYISLFLNLNNKGAIISSTFNPNPTLHPKYLMDCPLGIHVKPALGTLTGGFPDATQKPDDVSQLINAPDASEKSSTTF